MAERDVARRRGEGGEVARPVEPVGRERERARIGRPRERPHERGGARGHRVEDAPDQRLEEVGAPVGEARGDERGDLLVELIPVAAGELDRVGGDPLGAAEPRVEPVEERAQRGGAIRVERPPGSGDGAW